MLVKARTTLHRSLRLRVCGRAHEQHTHEESEQELLNEEHSLQ